MMQRLQLSESPSRRNQGDYRQLLCSVMLRLAKRDFNDYSINTVPEWKLFRFLSDKNRIFGAVIRQIFRLSPINVRPLFSRKKPAYNPKATALLYVATLIAQKKTPEYRSYVELLEKRLLQLRSGLTRNFAVKQNKELCVMMYKTSSEDVSPLITVVAGYAFFVAWRQTDDEKYLRLLKSVVAYFTDEHPRDEFDEGCYFYYEPHTNFIIYNASAEIAAFLLTVGHYLQDEQCCDLGRRAISFVISRQNEDGSWFYGSSKKCHYIDNFHSVMMLHAVYTAAQYGVEGAARSFEIGLDYYQGMFLSPEGIRRFDPRFKPLNSTLLQTVDLRDILLGSLLFYIMAKKDIKYEATAKRLLDIAIDKMFYKDIFYPEKTTLWTNKIPYIEFQAWGGVLLSVFTNDEW